MNIGRVLITLGIALVAAGLLFTIIGRLGMAKLPGDIVWRRGNTTVYVPIVTSIVVSIVLSLLMWAISRR